MKKVLLSQFGNADVLTVADVPVPEISSPNQVLIKVSHAGINPIDYKIRNGTSFVTKHLEKELPCGLGFEISGTVIAVGDDTQNTLLDKNVCGFVGFPLAPCGYAEYALADVNMITHIPHDISFAAASTLPLAGLTAWQCLDLLGPDIRGMKLLIHAGAGGVGHLAVQLAKLRGAEVITSASQKNHEFLYALGADRCLDYRAANYLDACGKVDGVLDLVGGDTGLNSIALLDKNKPLVTAPSMTKDTIVAAAEKVGVHATGMLMKPDMQQLDNLLSLVAQKKLQLHIAQIYPLEEVRKAHQQLEAGGFIGKLCLVV